MAIVGEKPETGVRFVLEQERTPEGGDTRDAGSDPERRVAPRWRYRGHVATKEVAHPLVVDVDADGTTRVTRTDGETPADLAEKARLLVRAVYKQCRGDHDKAGDDVVMPRKIVRWRGEK